eukprot:TRINITY_DN961_c0_g1_i1.p1 TRINITY_DN961_c0_g1~~TRINITY_DN961_c0_g1_i1.p1  ORF type:complete len:215 (+),score=57.29 TRINITY_DN961_c0_g1_i1:1-645(+)
MWDAAGNICVKASAVPVPVSCYSLPMSDCAQNVSCEWNQAMQVCTEKPVPCDTLRQDDCLKKPAQCMWDAAGNICVKASTVPVPVSCYSLPMSDCAQNVSCEWNQAMQVCTEKPVPCDTLRQDDCLKKPAQCMWDAAGNICVKASNVPVPVSCYSLPMNECYQNTSCEWDQSIQVCTEKPVPCDTLRQDDCLKKPAQCMWDAAGNICVKASNVP